MRTAHVPVEILRFQVEREHIRENRVHGAGNVFGGGTGEIARCCQWSIASLPKLCRFCRSISTHMIFLTWAGVPDRWPIVVGFDRYSCPAFDDIGISHRGRAIPRRGERTPAGGGGRGCGARPEKAE